jgi:hypothetical protein
MYKKIVRFKIIVDNISNAGHVITKITSVIKKLKFYLIVCTRLDTILSF